MKRLMFRMAAGLIAFLLGVAAVALWTLKYSTTRKLTAALTHDYRSTVKIMVKPQDEDSTPLDSYFITGNRLTYEGYEVTRSFDRESHQTSATIKKDGKVLVNLENGGGLSEDTTRIGLFSLLGRGTKQLIIEQYSGGAHCCWQYWIYELSPKLRLLFDSERYEVGYELGLDDIEKDGKFELMQSVMTFDYFYMSHASSPFPPAVFAYDEKLREYRPANRTYTEYLLDGIEREVNNLKEMNGWIDTTNPMNREQHFASVLDPVLKYIYAGKAEEGWSLYDEAYKLDDKAKMKAAIKKALKSDPVYRAIYQR